MANTDPTAAYVSPEVEERIEGELSESPMIHQVFVSGTASDLVAVVVPCDKALADYGGREEAVHSEELRNLVLKDIQRICEEKQMGDDETPKSVILQGEEFSPDSGFMTPAFKLKRPVLRNHYAKLFDEISDSIR